MLFSQSVDIPVLSTMPPLHVRSTGTHDGWLLRNAVVRSVTSILLQSLSTGHMGDWQTRQPKKVKLQYHPVGVPFSPVPHYFGPATLNASERGALSSSERGISMQKPPLRPSLVQ